ncbi:hypothetical protein, partial [Parachitinimonas caeni]
RNGETAHFPIEIKQAGLWLLDRQGALGDGSGFASNLDVMLHDANGRPLISGADGRWREARWLEPGRYDLTMRAYWGDQPYQFRL